MTNTLRAAFLPLVAAALAANVGCKQKTIIGYSSQVLEVESTGAQPIDGLNNDTGKVYSDAATNGVLNKAAASGLGLTGAPKSYGSEIAAKLARVEGRTALIVFGYGKDEAAQVKADIVKCKDLPGLPGQMPWPEGEYCLKPQGVGSTGQLALLSCGSLQGDSSCDSVTELFRLMGKTFVVNQQAKGLGLTEGDAVDVDSDFNNIAGHTIKGEKSTVSFNSQAGSTTIDNARSYTFGFTYGAGGAGLSLAGNDAASDETMTGVLGPNDGFEGYYASDNGDGGGGIAGGGDYTPPTGDGGGDVQMSLTDGKAAPKSKSRKRGPISPRDGGDPGAAGLRLTGGGGGPGYNAKFFLSN